MSRTAAAPIPDTRLPLDCTVDYFPNFLDHEDAKELYRTLIEEYELDKQQLIIEAGGQRIATDSYKILFLSAELIEQNSHPEEIHGKAYVWAGEIARLREKVECHTGKRFDLAMCLYYPDGTFFAPYHSDQETSGVDTVLPSLSLGEVREFSFREKGGSDTYFLDLDDGSLLLMGKWCQTRYEHSLPKDPKYMGGRINITFRESAFQ